MASFTTFQSALLREKFSIFDQNRPYKQQEPIIALSNRMVIRFPRTQNGEREDYVIRTQNMHTCIRFCSRIIQGYVTGGSFLNRPNGYDWESTWSPLVNDYERQYNEHLWASLYHKGKVIFESGERHPFLDLIEKCDHENSEEYDFAVPLAEVAFAKTGKDVKIEYDSNVALVMTVEKNEARCGIIFRGPGQTTTFNFQAFGNKANPTLSIAQCLSVGAAYLEAIQLAFKIGMNAFKMRVGLIERGSPEEKQTKDAQQRMNRLSAEIINLEDSYDVRYRPEKPEFSRIVAEAEELASKVIEY